MNIEYIEKIRKLPKETISNKIKGYRKTNRITQEELAQQLGIKRYTLLRWETCKTKISPIMTRLLIDNGIL